MPTETRQALVLSRVKSDFRANVAEKDPQEIEGMIQLAELQVDNLEVKCFFSVVRKLVKVERKKDVKTRLI